MIAQRLDPVPLMLGAALLAALGPSLLRGLRSVPRLWLGRSQRRLRRRLSPNDPAAAAAAAAAGAARPDGALEDVRVLDAARRLLAAWRETDDDAAALADADVQTREAALGLAMLEMATRHSDDAAKLQEICGPLLAKAAGGSSDAGVIALGALRKASTAAARQTLGQGRDERTAVLAATVKEERCGSFLMLSYALDRVASKVAAEEAAAAAAAAAESRGALAAAAAARAAAAEAVRGQIMLAFGMTGLDDRAEALRLSAASRILRLEARRTLRSYAALVSGPASSATSSASSAQRLLESSLSPLASLLSLERATLTNALLGEARDPMRADLEAALGEWVSERGPMAFERASHASGLALACLRFGERQVAGVAGAAGAAGAGAADVAGRSLGLTSTARHAMYGGFVRAAVIAQVESMAAPASSGRSEPAFGVGDAVVLRQLMSVLPASAAAAEASAFESAASLGRALGLQRAQLEQLAVQLGVRADRVDKALDAFG